MQQPPELAHQDAPAPEPVNLHRIQRSTVSAQGLPSVQRVSRFFSRQAVPLECL